jgi:hypothetical protein
VLDKTIRPAPIEGCQRYKRHEQQSAAIMSTFMAIPCVAEQALSNFGVGKATHMDPVSPVVVSNAQRYVFAPFARPVLLSYLYRYGYHVLPDDKPQIRLRQYRCCCWSMLLRYQGTVDGPTEKEVQQHPASSSLNLNITNLPPKPWTGFVGRTACYLMEYE